MNPIRLIPRNDTDTLARVERLASARGWRPLGLIPASLDEPFEAAWEVEGGKGRVHFIREPLLGLDYLYVEGEGVTEIAPLLAQAVGVLDEADVRRRVAGAATVGEKVQAVNELAILSPPE